MLAQFLGRLCDRELQLSLRANPCSVTHEKRDTVYVSFYNINGMGVESSRNRRLLPWSRCDRELQLSLRANPCSVTHEKRHTVWYVFFRGGRGWIRTTESGAGRFTVCSLWPLGNPSIIVVEHFIFKIGLSPSEKSLKVLELEMGVEPATY